MLTAAVRVHLAEAEALADLSLLGRYQNTPGNRSSVSDQHRVTWMWLEHLGENSRLLWGVAVGSEKCPGRMRKTDRPSTPPQGVGVVGDWASGGKRGEGSARGIVAQLCGRVRATEPHT